MPDQFDAAGCACTSTVSPRFTGATDFSRCNAPSAPKPLPQTTSSGTLAAREMLALCRIRRRRRWLRR